MSAIEFTRWFGKDCGGHAPKEIIRRTAILGQDFPQPRFGELAADDDVQIMCDRIAQTDKLGIGMGQRQSGIKHVVIAKPDACTQISDAAIARIGCLNRLGIARRS